MAHSGTPYEEKQDDAPPAFIKSNTVWLVVDVDNNLVDFEAAGISAIGWDRLENLCEKLSLLAKQQGVRFALAISTSKIGTDELLDAVVKKFARFLCVIDTRTGEMNHAVEYDGGSKYLTRHCKRLYLACYGEESPEVAGTYTAGYDHFFPSIQICQFPSTMLMPDRTTKGEGICELLTVSNGYFAVLMDDDQRDEWAPEIAGLAEEGHPVAFISTRDAAELSRLTDQAGRAAFNAYLDEKYARAEVLLTDAILRCSPARQAYQCVMAKSDAEIDPHTRTALACVSYCMGEDITKGMEISTMPLP